MIGPAKVGSVRSIGLGPTARPSSSSRSTLAWHPCIRNGRADLRELAVWHRQPLHRARARPQSAPAIPAAGLIDQTHTYSFVSLDSAVRHARCRPGSVCATSSAVEAAEHPGQGGPGPPDAPVLRAGAAEHQQRDPGADARRASVRRAARAGRPGDADARLASQELTQLVANTNATTAGDRQPEHGAAAGAVAAPAGAQPLDQDVRGPPQDTRLARPAGGGSSPRRAGWSRSPRSWTS